MNQQEALNLIIGAVRTANRRGAFEVEESADIATAIKAFTEPAQTEAEKTAEEWSKIDRDPDYRKSNPSLMDEYEKPQAPKSPLPKPQ